MKPVIILPPGQMNSTNMKMLRDNGFCVVTAKDPSKVQFLDPVPAASSRTEMENAAIKLSRKLLNPGAWNTESWAANDRSMQQNICKMYMDILMKGTPLDPKGSIQEQERAVINQARMDELAKIAREEARAERAAKKAQQTK